WLTIRQRTGNPLRKEIKLMRFFWKGYSLNRLFWQIIGQYALSAAYPFFTLLVCIEAHGVGHHSRFQFSTHIRISRAVLTHCAHGTAAHPDRHSTAPLLPDIGGRGYATPGAGG